MANNSTVWTIQRILLWTTEYLKKHGLDSPRLDAELLLAYVLKKPRIYLYTEFEKILNSNELASFRNLIQKRVEGTCTAVLIGEKSFMGLNFYVNEEVLVPRPDTEAWLERVIQYHRNDSKLHVVDLGTGSGAILLSFLYYCKNATGLGIDLSSEALVVAKKNEEKLDLSSRTEWREGNYIEALKEELFDGVLTNPPYIPTTDIQSLSKEVKKEPYMALDGGLDGLDFYRKLAQNIVPHIRPGGFLALELGIGQVEAVEAMLMATNAFDRLERIPDLGDVDRALYGRKKMT